MGSIPDGVRRGPRPPTPRSRVTSAVAPDWVPTNKDCETGVRTETGLWTTTEVGPYEPVGEEVE